MPRYPIDMLSINLFGFEGTGLVFERCYFDRMLFAAQVQTRRTHRTIKQKTSYCILGQPK